MFLFFDTETTGLPLNYYAPLEDLNNWPRLVQLAWVVYNNQEEKIAGENFIIKPEGFIIPEQASRVHGITTQRALSEGESLAPVLERFAQAIEEAKIIIAHNISFDEKIIGAEFLRKNIDHNLFDTVRVCTKEEATEYCQLPGNYGYKWPRLDELHIKLFGESFSGAHDALADVEACARCFFELVKRGVIGK
ncbi:MAG: 3'-5' exonuclease [Patescibacteria group bacterium]|nr:3'-5' exonuclease [Patescibacteria group bacterium]MDD4611355.1 3'-5' exonuclease [Patescibacteria group bacterium]